MHRDERAVGVTCSEGTSNSALACSHWPCNAHPHPSADLDVLFHSVSRTHTRQALVLLVAPICDRAHSLSSLHSAHADAAPRLLPPHSAPDHQGWPPTPPPQRVCLRRPRLHLQSPHVDVQAPCMTRDAGAGSILQPLPWKAFVAVCVRQRARLQVCVWTLGAGRHVYTCHALHVCANTNFQRHAA